ncbi:MAG: AMIN domain-containing protein [Candidatus Sulfotelmatobacter sp.]
MFAFPLFLQSRSTAQQESLPGSQVPATIVHLKLLLDDGPPAVEIITTAPVVPKISKLEGPTRLLIDLPNTNMSVSSKLVPVQSSDVSAIRLELGATDPPVVHVEVALRKAMDYTWESAGNRLLVHLRAAEVTPAKVVPAPVPAPAAKVAPVSAPADAATLGTVVPLERLASGDSITASADTTVLRLPKGGEFYVCPRTTVSVTRSRSGPDMMLAIGAGAMETHITLDNSTDEVVTPDFRILLRGPGEFDYAIRADPQGNTCVRTLPGNTSSAIIYELMGNGKFEFQPKDQIVFHGGRLNPEDTALHSASASGDSTILPVDCGCPPPLHPMLLASNAAVAEASGESDPPTAPAASSGFTPAVPETRPSAEGNGGGPAPKAGVQIAELPAAMRNQPHVEAQAVLTFRPSPSVPTFPLSGRRTLPSLTALPPPPPVRHKRFEGVRNFFAKIFG